MNNRWRIEKFFLLVPKKSENLETFQSQFRVKQKRRGFPFQKIQNILEQQAHADCFTEIM